MSNRAIGISAVLVVLLAVGAAWLLLAHYGGGTEADKARLEAIRTVGTIVLGAGGAFALLLAARRQQTAERDLAQKERVQLHAEQDATERRITELYLKAADQLGSDKAPVRLAALRALERLAQGNPGQRQTIVDVICAYLRMPYTPPSNHATSPRRLGYRRPIRPGHPLPSHRPAVSAPVSESADTAQQEREVRLTAQRILVTHLYPGPNQAHHTDTFWPDIDVDLTSAILIDFNLSRCRVRTVQFRNASFAGTSQFSGATFTGDAWFSGATFTGDAWFSAATFTGNAEFSGATFTGEAEFSSATFTGDAWFSGATFTGNTVFSAVTFTGHALFGEAIFTGNTVFGEATFNGQAEFNRAAFPGNVWFRKATFTGNALFGEATFNGQAEFSETTFTENAWFGEATFTGHAEFSGATFTKDVEFRHVWVRLDVDRRVRRSWPTGWTISTEPTAARSDVQGDWTTLVLGGSDTEPGSNPPG